MASILRSLIWKEWREQRWKLGFGCALLVSVTAIGLRVRLVEDLAVHVGVVAIGGILLPLFVAIGLVAAERADGSLVTLLSMPVSPRLVFAVKMAMGAVVTAAPFAAACAAGLLLAGEREAAAGEVVGIGLWGVLHGLISLVWIACLGIGQPSEARAGLIGLAWLGGCLITDFVVSTLLQYRNPLWHPWAWAAVAAGQALSGVRHFAGWTIFHVGVASALLSWAAWRLSRTRRARA